MASIIKLKRGLTANVEALTLQSGEPAFATDTGKLYIGNGISKVLINPNFGTAASKDTGASAGNVPVIGVDGKIDNAIIPAIAITEVYEVSSEAEMIGLTAQIGDVAVRSDENKSYILGDSPASTLVNWIMLKTPSDSVLSVSGKTGVVSLNQSDVGLSNVTNESKSTMFNNAALTGLPSAPTAPIETNNTQIASTGFVKSQGYLTSVDIENISIDGGTF